MTKECTVIINNDAVTVVKFGDKKIQFPAIGKDVKTVKVKYVKGKYSIEDKADSKVEAVEPEIEADTTEQVDEMKTIIEDESTEIV